MGERIGSLAPWPSLELARSFLHGLADGRTTSTPPGVELEPLARWLRQHELAPLAYARAREVDPGLAGMLRDEAYSVAAENSMHLALVDEVLSALADSGIPAVLLKGVALAHAVYDDPAQRSMSDIDLWIPAKAMAQALQRINGLGYRLQTNPNRPLAWQELVGGEVQLVKPGWTKGLLELHWSPFAGEWLKTTAAIDLDAVWQQRSPLALGKHSVATLSPEHTVFHLALHLVIGPKLGRTALRTFMDLGLLARRSRIDWESVARQARQWRVARAVSAVLWLTASLVGLPDLDLRILVDQRPGLNRLVSPRLVLAGRDWEEDPRGYVLLAWLTDRPTDMLDMFWHILWPDQTWLHARYGSDASVWTHWSRLTRRRE